MSVRHLVIHVVIKSKEMVIWVQLGRRDPKRGYVVDADEKLSSVRAAVAQE